MSATGSPQGFPNINQPIASATGIITRPWLQLLIALWNRTGAALGGSIVPPGTVADFAGAVKNIPDGWLACGQAVSRTQYAMLFDAIGTTWGPGDGSSTFDLPPQNVFNKGVGADNVGDTGGSSTTTISIAELPAHSHPVVDPGHTHAVTDPGHAHTITDPGHVHASLVADAINTAGAAAGATQAGNTSLATTGVTVNSNTTGVTNQNNTTGISTGNTGAGTPIPILPPYAVFLKMIKT